MRENKDTDSIRLMAAAMIVILAVVLAVIFGFKQLRRKQETALAQDTRQEEATVKIQDIYEEEKEAGESVDDEEDFGEASVTESASQDDENADIYVVKGEDKTSNRYERANKLTYTDSIRYTEEELKVLDQYGLRITRNEIFARHGRMFNDQELQKYFDNQPWYVPKYSPGDFDDSCLNEVEVDNVKLIMSYEQAQGYQ